LPVASLLVLVFALTQLPELSACVGHSVLATLTRASSRGIPLRSTK
jgi:hypothetical protein